MALAVAISNLIYFAFTGARLPSPNYGALTRRGHESNPGGRVSPEWCDVVICRVLFGDAPQAKAKETAA